MKSRFASGVRRVVAVVLLAAVPGCSADEESPQDAVRWSTARELYEHDGRAYEIEAFTATAAGDGSGLTGSDAALAEETGTSYVWAYATDVTFTYVTPVEPGQGARELALVSSVTEVWLAHNTPGVAQEGGEVIATIEQGATSSTYGPTCDVDAGAAVRAYLDEDLPVLCHSGRIDLLGIDGEAVGSLDPVAPEDPSDLS